MRLIALSCLWLWLAGCHFDVQLDTKPDGSGSQDAGDGDVPDAGPEMMGEPDANEMPPPDAGPFEPQPVVFKDDFERASGPLTAPWKDAGTGTPKIWAGQLCLASQETALLTLAPGDYRYLRVDVTGGLGLRWTLESEEGEFLSFLWYSDNSQITASSGEELAGFTRMQVRSVEVLLDPGTRSAKVRVDHGAWTNVTYAPKVRPKLVRMRFQSTYLDPQSHSGTTECFDNVYAGPEQPAEDPFKDSPPARPGWYTDDPTSLCLEDHCGKEMIACLDEGGSWDCQNSYDSFVGCLASDPSGTIAHCSWFKFSVAAGDIKLSDAATKAMIACADAHCDTDIASTPIVPINGGAYHEQDPIPNTDLVLAITRHGNDLDVVEVDLGTGAVTKLGTTLTQAFKSAADSPDVRLYTAGTHEWRSVELIAHDGSQRMFASRRGFWAEVIVSQPFVSFQVFPTRAWIWVDSAPSVTAAKYTHQFLYTDGAACIRTTDDHGSNDYVTIHDAADGSHPYAISNSASGPTIFAMGKGFIRKLTPGVGSAWRTMVTFDESVIFRNSVSGVVRWMGVDNQPISKELPPGVQVGSYWMSSSSIYFPGADAFETIAAKPNDLIDEVPVASNDVRVLYENAQHWVFADTSGNRVGEYVPEPFADMSAGESMATAARFTLGANCGVLVSKRAAVSEERVALDVFHFDGDGKLVVERLDTLAQTAESVRVAVRREGLFAWQHGTDLCAYDCSATRSYLTHPVGDAVVALGDYPVVPQHFIPAPPTAPGTDP